MTSSAVQISQFGRAVGPGDLYFRSPLSVAYDVTSGRIFAADADGACVKVFDARASFVTEFGAGDVSETGNGNRSAAMLDRPVGVSCDSLGNAIVCDVGAQRVVLYSRDGRYLCPLINFRSGSAAQSKWQRRPDSDSTLLPVCVGLSTPGNRIAVGLDSGRGEKSRRFRKVVVYNVTPEL